MGVEKSKEQMAAEMATALAEVLPTATIDFIAHKAMTAAFQELEYGSHYEIREVVKGMVAARVRELLAGDYATKIDEAAVAAIGKILK